MTATISTRRNPSGEAWNIIWFDPWSSLTFQVSFYEQSRSSVSVVDVFTLQKNAKLPAGSQTHYYMYFVQSPTGPKMWFALCSDLVSHLISLTLCPSTALILQGLSVLRSTSTTADSAQIWSPRDSMSTTERKSSSSRQRWGLVILPTQSVLINSLFSLLFVDLISFTHVSSRKLMRVKSFSTITEKSQRRSQNGITILEFMHACMVMNLSF